MKSFFPCVAGVFLLSCMLMQRPAAAHAMLDHAEPRVGADVGQSPSQLKLWYTQRLEPAFSKIQVFDAGGKEVDRKDTHLDPNDKAKLVVSLPPLSAGTYKVKWHVVSVDTHRTQGDFKFTVKR
jgi:copper resistance protein C